jgi:hypothetical protein
MKIILENNEKENLFFLCLAVGGLAMLERNDIILTFSDSSYKEAVKSFKEKYGEKELTHEGVLLEMMKIGYGLNFKFKDYEGEYSVVLNYEDMLNAFDKVDTKVLLRMFDEFYDGYDAFNLLQCILYGELIF